MPTAASSTAPALLPERKKKLIARLARVEGQLRGVQRMIGRDEECEAVAQQVAAARGALDRAFAEVIACALEQRLAADGVSPAVHDRLSEITTLLAKYG